MIYPIVKFGNSVLEKPSETVTVFDEELEKLTEDMPRVGNWFRRV